MKTYFESSCCGAIMSKTDILIKACPLCDGDCSAIEVPYNIELVFEQDNWLNPQPNDPRQLKLEL